MIKKWVVYFDLGSDPTGVDHELLRGAHLRIVGGQKQHHGGDVLGEVGRVARVDPHDDGLVAACRGTGAQPRGERDARLGLACRHDRVLQVERERVRFARPVPVAEGFAVRDQVMRDMAGEMEAAGRNAMTAKGFELESLRIARLMKDDRDKNFVAKNAAGTTVNRWITTGFLAASATTNETAFMTYKVVRSAGMLVFDNQARV